MGFAACGVCLTITLLPVGLLVGASQGFRGSAAGVRQACGPALTWLCVRAGVHQATTTTTTPPPRPPLLLATMVLPFSSTSRVLASSTALSPLMLLAQSELSATTPPAGGTALEWAWTVLHRARQPVVDLPPNVGTASRRVTTPAEAVLQSEYDTDFTVNGRCGAWRAVGHRDVVARPLGAQPDGVDGQG